MEHSGLSYVSCETFGIVPRGTIERNLNGILLKSERAGNNPVAKREQIENMVDERGEMEYNRRTEILKG